jgi:hypothetical protein
LQSVWLQSAWLESAWLQSAWLQSANIQRFSNLTLKMDEGLSTAVYRMKPVQMLLNFLAHGSIVLFGG